MNTATITVLICTNERFGLHKPSCGGRGSHELFQRLQKQCSEQQLPVTVEAVACFGRCHEGPNLRINPGGGFYHNVTLQQLQTIMQQLQQLCHDN